MEFFSAAGLPEAVAENYAVTFADHRIQRDMLMDLDKECLREMGEALHLPIILQCDRISLRAAVPILTIKWNAFMIGIGLGHAM